MTTAITQHVDPPGAPDHIPDEQALPRIFTSSHRVSAQLLTAIESWLQRYSIVALRISMGAVFLGFGVMKYFPGLSPAQSLALATTHLLTLGLVPAVVPARVALVLIATLECTIGVSLITGWWLRRVLYLLAFELVGILSPAVLLTGRLFSGPDHMPTLEGQYVLKDVILLTAAMVIATTLGRSRAVRREGSTSMAETEIGSSHEPRAMTAVGRDVDGLVPHTEAALAGAAPSVAVDDPAARTHVIVGEDWSGTPAGSPGPGPSSCQPVPVGSAQFFRSGPQPQGR